MKNATQETQQDDTTAAGEHVQSTYSKSGVYVYSTCCCLALMCQSKAGPFDTCTTQAWKQTSGDPSGLTGHYCAITLL